MQEIMVEMMLADIPQAWILVLVDILHLGLDLLELRE
jgi:hypothetical protein